MSKEQANESAAQVAPANHSQAVSECASEPAADPRVRHCEHEYNGQWLTIRSDVKCPWCRINSLQADLAAAQAELAALKTDSRFQLTEQMLEAVARKQAELEAELAGREKPYEGIPSSVSQFESFINESSQYEDRYMVREYRHQVYFEWVKVVNEFRRLAVQIIDKQEEIKRLNSDLTERKKPCEDVEADIIHVLAHKRLPDIHIHLADLARRLAAQLRSETGARTALEGERTELQAKIGHLEQQNRDLREQVKEAKDATSGMDEENFNLRKQLAASPEQERVSAPKEMVDRFLNWSLPKTFAPDGGISFKRLATSWPIGTNLLTADEARQMLEYVLAAKSSRSPE